MRTARHLAMLLAAAWLVANRAPGQMLPATGSLYCTVLDSEGKAVAGVAVTLTGPGSAQALVTDGRGEFRFSSLSPGDYAVLLEKSGFESTRRAVPITVGRTASLSITLGVAGTAEVVTVSGAPGALVLDERKIETGASYGRKELDSIPTTRDPWAILRQVPGVRVDNVNVGGEPEGRQSFFTGKGSSTEQNSYVLDGVPINVGAFTPMFFDFDSFEGITVATGGTDLNLAAPGVTLNLVTRRGTNEFRGSARGLYAGGAGWEYGAEAGGPLWRDRVWIWGAFARNDFLGQEFELKSQESLQTRDAFNHLNGKLDAQPFPSNTLTLSATNFQRRTVGGASGPDYSLSATGDTYHPGSSYKIEDSQVVSANLFASFDLAYLPAGRTDTPHGDPADQALFDERGVLRRNGVTQHVRDDKHQAGFSASSFFDTGDLRHELKLGFGYRHVLYEFAQSWPADRLVGYLPMDPAELSGAAAITRDQDTKSILNVYDVLLGDTAHVGHLTVSVGARFDYQQGRNLASAVAANPVFPELLPAIDYPGDRGYPITWRNVEPRVGATYALDEGGTLLRGSYSRFADRLDSMTVLLLGAFPGIAELGYPWTDSNSDGRVERGEVDVSSPLLWYGAVDPGNPGSTGSIDRIAKALKAPTTDEFIAAVERQFAPDLTGSLSYTHRTIQGLEFWTDVGVNRDSYRYVGNAAGTVVGADGFAASFDEPYYGQIDCPPCAGLLVQNRPDYEQSYDGVDVQILKAWSHGWMARAAFGYQDWRQRVGSGSIVNPNDVGSNSTGALFDARWQFNLSGMVELPLGISASANLFGREGYPVGDFVHVFPLDGHNRELDILIPSLNSDRTPPVYQLDLQLSTVFRIGSAVSVIPQLSCFNVLDSHTVLARDGQVGVYYPASDSAPQFVGNDDFHFAYERMSKRVLRGGVRIEF